MEKEKTVLKCEALFFAEDCHCQLRKRDTSHPARYFLQRSVKKVKGQSSPHGHCFPAEDCPM